MDQSTNEIQDEHGIPEENLYIPEVRSSLIPVKGMQFISLDEAQLFYNNYAKDAGFSTRINDSKKIDGLITWKEFVCSKEGERREQPGPSKQRRRGLTREKCCARMAVRLDKESKHYVVSLFNDAHTHSLTTPRKHHLLRSHRKVSKVQKSLVDQLQLANIPTCHQMNVLTLEAGGVQNVGFIARDLYNARRDDRNIFDEHDAELLKEYFEKQVSKNSEFEFSIKEDEKGRLVHCFWTHAAWRESYKHFGDVVVFDTTFNTNKYSLIFAPIIGLNHHSQSIIFGCAFLSDEKTSSFEWLFNEWLAVMPVGPPKLIITDQDAAMTKAFTTVLPDTCHRYCIWHILMKLSEKLGPLIYKESQRNIKACIWESETPEEFEERWVFVLEKHGLIEHEWLNSIYKIRSQWVPAYMMNIFSAGMRSSQRSESAHSFFKGFVTHKNSLWEFITRFKRGCEKLRENEEMLDQVDFNEKPVLKTQLAIEEYMREWYTRATFYKVQDEVIASLRCKVEKIDEDYSTYLRYTVTYMQEPQSRVRLVQVEQLGKKITCTCTLFEREGIPCRHLLAYFFRANIYELRDQFKLNRWLKSSKVERKRYDLDGAIVGSGTLTKRHSLLQRASRLIDDAIMNESRTKVLENAFEAVEHEFRVSQQAHEVASTSQPVAASQFLKNPQKTKPKGSNKRSKFGFEMKKPQKCKACGLKGHDRRKCQSLADTAPTSIDLECEDDMFPSCS